MTPIEKLRLERIQRDLNAVVDTLTRDNPNINEARFSAVEALKEVKELLAG